MLIIGLIIGCIVGVIIGVIVMSFYFVVKANDEYAMKYQAEWEREQNENNS